MKIIFLKLKKYEDASDLTVDLLPANQDIFVDVAKNIFVFTTGIVTFFVRYVMCKRKIRKMQN